MIKKYNDISLAVGIPGLIIQIYGWISQIPIISLVGGILLIVGLAYYAKSKKRHPAWGLLGILSIMGIIILALLPDSSSDAAIKTLSIFTKIFLIFILLLILAANIILILRVID